MDYIHVYICIINQIMRISPRPPGGVCATVRVTRLTKNWEAFQISIMGAEDYYWVGSSRYEVLGRG